MGLAGLRCVAELLAARSPLELHTLATRGPQGPGGGRGDRLREMRIPAPIQACALPCLAPGSRCLSVAPQPPMPHSLCTPGPEVFSLFLILHTDPSTNQNVSGGPLLLSTATTSAGRPPSFSSCPLAPEVCPHEAMSVPRDMAMALCSMPHPGAHGHSLVPLTVHPCTCVPVQDPGTHAVPLQVSGTHAWYPEHSMHPTPSCRVWDPLQRPPGRPHSPAFLQISSGT